MRTGFSILGAGVGLVTLVVWLATGAHTGWTKTQVTVMKVDEITELEYPETQDQFVAGVELLGSGLLLSLVLLGGSRLFKPTINQPLKENQP